MVSVAEVTFAPAGKLEVTSKAITARRVGPLFVRPTNRYSPAPLLRSPVLLWYSVLSFDGTTPTSFFGPVG
jgi:hypothetical protein